MERVTGSVRAPPPAIAPTAPEPAHVVEAFGVAAIVMPDGSVSTSAAENVAAVVLALVSVIVTVDAPFAAMVLGSKTLETVGATAFTARVALAAAALFP